MCHNIDSQVSMMINNDDDDDDDDDDEDSVYVRVSE